MVMMHVSASRSHYYTRLLIHLILRSLYPDCDVYTTPKFGSRCWCRVASGRKTKHNDSHLTYSTPHLHGSAEVKSQCFVELASLQFQSLQCTIVVIVQITPRNRPRTLSSRRHMHRLATQGPQTRRQQKAYCEELAYPYAKNLDLVLN